MNLTANELHFLKQAVEQANVKGKDTLFVAEVLIKVSKGLEAQAKAEGLLPESGDPISPTTGEPMQPMQPAQAMQTMDAPKLKEETKKKK